MRHPLVKSFTDGFIGSFVIAAIILLAIPRALNEVMISRSHQEQTRSEH